MYFLLDTSGVGAGPCFPSSTVCGDLRSPTTLGSDVADAHGRARLTVRSTVPAGRTVRLQAAWIDRTGGAITGDTTQVLALTSQ